MNARRAFRWASYYFALTTVVAVVGLVLVGVGVGFDALQAYQTYQSTGSMTAALGTLGLGAVLAVVGVAIWRFGRAWALYWTLTGAIKGELGDELDTEHVKSDILNVLDDRLADMQHEMNSINRQFKELQADDDGEEAEFEFGT